MKKHILAILLSLYTANVFAGYGGNIGLKDDRHYGSLSDPKFNGVVKLRLGPHKGSCTGVFISKNLILTNDHCAVHCRNGGCTAEFWNGNGYERSNLKIADFREKYDILDGSDWAILYSEKESHFYKDIIPNTTKGSIYRGGFGMLRIINDNEIPFLKRLYKETAKEFEDECRKTQNAIACINKHVEKKLEEMGKRPLFKDNENFKVQNCHINGTHPKSNKMVSTDCDSAGGDSGAPLLRSGRIVGLNNSGSQGVFSNNEYYGANGLKTENFYEYAKKNIQKYQTPVSSTPSQQPPKPPKPISGNHTHPSTQPTVQPPKPTTGNNTQPITLPTVPPVTQPVSPTPAPSVQPNTQPTVQPIVQPVEPMSEEQRIQQMLNQRLQYFDCD